MAATALPFKALTRVTARLFCQHRWDVNGDGFDDLLVGLLVLPQWQYHAGETIVFGKQEGFAAS